MYLPEDIRLNILEYNPFINIKVSDELLLERIQVIDPSFSLSHAIQDFNRRKKDESSSMYPLFLFLYRYKRLIICDICDNDVVINICDNDYKDLLGFISINYPNVSSTFMGKSISLVNIDGNELYRLFATYRNKHDSLTYKLEESWSRMEAMKENMGFMDRMIKYDLLHLYNDTIYSTDEIQPIDSSFSLRDQLQLTIERINRDKQIRAKIESLKLSNAYDLYLQMRDKPYYMYLTHKYDKVGLVIDTTIPLIFPDGIIVDSEEVDGSYIEYSLSGDLSILFNVALLYVLHDDYNYTFEEERIFIN